MVIIALLAVKLQVMRSHECHKEDYYLHFKDY